MPDPITRKKLRKKVLDRWENEGGKVLLDRDVADAPNTTLKRTPEQNPTIPALDKKTPKPV